jgi:2-polyprenyl-3-methyl-5-hydroxy-6-metoxy-1,4-benzoquinol methylase
MEPSRTVNSPEPEGFTYAHKLPRSRPVDRRKFLTDIVRGQTVIDIGFVDYPLLEARLETGEWLHGQLAAAAASIVGIDQDDLGVEWANQHGFSAYAADIQSIDDIRRLTIEPADVVTACELIEHLDKPGLFLQAVRPLCAGILVITTPNAYRLLNTVIALTGRELIHPEHTALYSPRALTRTLEMNGWRTEWIGYYYERPSVPAGGFRHSLAIRGVNLVEALQSSRFAPGWSSGLIVTARPS